MLVEPAAEGSLTAPHVCAAGYSPTAYKQAKPYAIQHSRGGKPPACSMQRQALRKASIAGSSTAQTPTALATFATAARFPCYYASPHTCAASWAQARQRSSWSKPDPGTHTALYLPCPNTCSESESQTDIRAQHPTAHTQAS